MIIWQFWFKDVHGNHSSKNGLVIICGEKSHNSDCTTLVMHDIYQKEKAVNCVFNKQKPRKIIYIINLYKFIKNINRKIIKVETSMLTLDVGNS